MREGKEGNKMKWEEERAMEGEDRGIQAVDGQARMRKHDANKE